MKPHRPKPSSLPRTSGSMARVHGVGAVFSSHVRKANNGVPSAGQLRQQINALGHSTFHEYDLQGRETYTWGPRGAAAIVGGAIGIDIAAPEPSDMFWPKWLVYGAAMAAAVMVDFVIDLVSSDASDSKDSTKDDSKTKEDAIPTAPPEEEECKRKRCPPCPPPAPGGFRVDRVPPIICILGIMR